MYRISGWPRLDYEQALWLPVLIPSIYILVNVPPSQWRTIFVHFVQFATKTVQTGIPLVPRCTEMCCRDALIHITPKFDYIIKGASYGHEIAAQAATPRQRHKSGVLKVDSACGARGPWFETWGKPPFLTLPFWGDSLEMRRAGCMVRVRYTLYHLW